LFALLINISDAHSGVNIQLIIWKAIKRKHEQDKSFQVIHIDDDNEEGQNESERDCDDSEDNNNRMESQNLLPKEDKTAVLQPKRKPILQMTLLPNG
jgi:hypothetical protein